MGRRQRAIERNRMRGIKPLHPDTVVKIGVLYVGTAAISAITISAILVHHFFNQVLRLWANYPHFFESSLGVSATVVVVSAIGAIFFTVREKALFIYAWMELGTAIGLTIEACYRIGPSQNKGALIVALLGAIYIVVRALDNFTKAWKVRRQKSQPMPIELQG